MPFDPFHHPIATDLPRRITKAAAWSEHIPFAMTLIDLLRPRLFVELGTFWGDSYCAFCQAVDRLKTGTKCIAVDTWEGDTHTGHYNGILGDLKAHHDPLYSSFSTLKQTLFDAAVGEMENGSIDLLHIDGLHTYEAVLHDFQTWLPKMSDRGVVLFHDTAEREADFGVWKLWEEISPRYPSFQFPHGHGLGVLGVGTTLPEPMKAFFAAAANDPQRIRLIYYVLGTRVQFFKSSSMTLSSVYATQQTINAYHRARGQEVDETTESPEIAQRFPADFAEHVRREVEALCEQRTA